MGALAGRGTTTRYEGPAPDDWSERRPSSWYVCWESSAAHCSSCAYTSSSWYRTGECPHEVVRYCSWVAWANGVAELSLDSQMLFKELDSFLVSPSVVRVLLEFHSEVADFLFCFQGGSTYLARWWPGFKAAPLAALRSGEVIPAR